MNMPATTHNRAEDLDHRVAEHLAGRGARLIEVITQAGIGFRLARTWPGVTRARERQLKRQGGASRHCPICQDERKARSLPHRPANDRDPGHREQQPSRGQGRQPWAPAVPTRGTRPDRVRAFLELNPGFARPARASQAKQWGARAAAKRSSCSAPELLAPPGMKTPNPPNTGSPPSPAAPSRPACRPASNAALTGPNRPEPHELAARTHQRLLARQRQAAGSRRPPRIRQERERER